MSEVSLAPAGQLGRRRQTSFNEVPNLPLGDDVATITQRLNDDDLTIDYKVPTIADSKARNDIYLDHAVTPLRQALIGKKESELAPSQFDLTAVRAFEKKYNDRQAVEEERFYIQSRFNNVYLPFTTAEPMDYGYTLPS
ncbi:MAG: hypothetical protein Q7R33_02045 [Nitrosarchaeum sp.]|nr:hypothetical protein [Nitrosarchaeum sp.]